MKKILLTALILCWCSSAWASEISRYRNLPSCVLAESLDSIETLERKGWTVSGNPTVVDTAYGKAMAFDGNDYVEYLDVNASEGIPEISISVWIYPTASGATNTNIVSKGSYYTADGSWSLQYGASERLAFAIAQSAWSFSVLKITENEWNHVAVAYSNTNNTVVLYVNGVAVHSGLDGGSFVDIPDTANPIRIGSTFPGGNIKNALIFNRVLSAQEISDIYYGRSFDYYRDEVSHWDMSEINPQDIGWKGNGNDGTGTGLVASTDIICGQEQGCAIEFDGSNEFVTVTRNAELDFGTNDFSISAWFKWADSGVQDTLIAKSDGSATSDDGYLLRTGSDGFIYFELSDGTSEDFAGPTTTVNDSRWHHIVASRDSGNILQLVLDGEFQDSSTDNSYDVTNADNLFFATEADGGADFTGRMSSVTFYSSPLTTLQSESIYVESRKGGGQ